MHPCFCVFRSLYVCVCMRYRINFISMAVFCFCWSTLCLVKHSHSDAKYFLLEFFHIICILHSPTSTSASISLFLYGSSSIWFNLFTAKFTCLFHRRSTISMFEQYCMWLIVWRMVFSSFFRCILHNCAYCIEYVVVVCFFGAIALRLAFTYRWFKNVNDVERSGVSPSAWDCPLGRNSNTRFLVCSVGSYLFRFRLCQWKPHKCCAAKLMERQQKYRPIVF